jgi:hypothetical protein
MSCRESKSGCGEKFVPSRELNSGRPVQPVTDHIDFSLSLQQKSRMKSLRKTLNVRTLTPRLMWVKLKNFRLNAFVKSYTLTANVINTRYNENMPSRTHVSSPTHHRKVVSFSLSLRPVCSFAVLTALQYV